MAIDLSVLDEDQRVAAEAPRGPVCILAGAGTGKTRTITYRIANLIDRVFRDGHVVDYMVLNVGPAHTGVFNIADIAITVGALYLLIDLFVKPRKA